MMKFLRVLLAAAAFLLPSLAFADVADSIMKVDSAVRNQVNKWALNKTGFAPADQPCYFTKTAKGARACSFPSAAGSVAVLFNARDFQSYKGKDSWECYYQRPQMAIVLPKMIRRAEAAGLGDDPYVGHLRAALAYLTAWQAALPSLPNIRDGGYCTVNIAP